MELFKSGSLNIDFVGKRKRFIWFSTMLVVFSLLVVVGRQMTGTMNWGIDFAGGTVINLEFDREIDVGEVRNVVQNLGYTKNVIQSGGVGGRRGKAEYIIRVERIAILDVGDAEKVHQGLKQAFGEVLLAFEFDADGGDQFGLRFGAEVAEKDLKEALAKLANQVGKKELSEIILKRQGKEDEHRYMVLMTGVATQIEQALKQAFSDAKPFLRKVEFVGPEVGEKLRNDGILAMIYALAGILVYVGFRFNMLFAPGAIIALAHDAIVTIGLFALFQFEFNLTFVAAVLTIIGYSINDTIVIYDRVRENMARYRSQPLEKLINTSLNETLGRTIITSFTVLLSLVGLLIVGFGEIRDFAIAMTFGLFTGTYSTIYIAGSLTIYLDNFTKRLRSA